MSIISPLLIGEIIAVRGLGQPSSNFVGDHLIASSINLTHLLPQIHAWTRYSDPQVNCGWQVDFVLDPSLKVQANCFLESTQHVTCEVSMGLYLALNDAFHRSMCMQGILLEEVRRREDNYVYTEPLTGAAPFHCIETTYSCLRPTARFFDYTPQSNFGGHAPSQLGAFFQKVPLLEERLLLAEWLTILGLTFVLLHEEAHYVHGHLHLLDELKPSLGISTKEFGLGVGVTDGRPFFDAQTLKSLEWEADGSASRGLIDVFLPASFPWPQLDSFPTDDQAWRLRALIFAIGVVFQVLDIGALHIEPSNRYPTIMCRFIDIAGKLTNSIQPINLPDDKEELEKYHAKQWEIYMSTAGAVSDMQYFAHFLSSEPDICVPTSSVHLCSLSVEDILKIPESVTKMGNYCMFRSLEKQMISHGESHDEALWKVVKEGFSNINTGLKYFESEWIEIYEFHQRKIRDNLSKHRIAAIGHDPDIKFKQKYGPYI